VVDHTKKKKKRSTMHFSETLDLPLIMFGEKERRKEEMITGLFVLTFE